MNKNRSTIIMILIIFFIVGIFLYVVFKSNRFKSSEQTESSLNKSLDVANYIEPDNWDEIVSDGVVNGEIIDEIDVNDNLVIKKEVLTTKKINKESPDTGADTMLVIVAIIISFFVSMFVYKKQKIA